MSEEVKYEYQFVICPKCNGRGLINNNKNECDLCQGRREVRKEISDEYNTP